MIKKLIYLVAVLFTVGLVSSCQKLEEPENPAEHKGHDDPTTINISFTPGTLNDAVPTSAYAYDFTPTADAPTSHVKWHMDKDLHIKVTGEANLKQNQWYHLHIDFTDVSNTDINFQFMQSEKMRSIHQFMLRPFQSETGIDIINNTDSSVFEYKYGDKWEGQKIAGIGFDGYIKVKKDAPARFYLNIILLHIISGTKIQSNGQILPFHGFVKDASGEYIPNKFLMGVTDLNFRFPVNVIQ